MKRSNRGALIAPIFGLSFLFFGVKELYQVNRFLTRGEQTDGIIVEMRKGSSKLSKYHPLIRFQTKEGKTIEFSPGNGSNPPMYEVNDRGPIVYNPDYPHYAVINSFTEIWLAPVIYAGLGLLLLISSGFQRIKSKSQST